MERPNYPHKVPTYPNNVEFYQSGFFKPKWRWRITADNGRIIAASSQGYADKRDAEYNLVQVGRTLGEVKLVQRW